MMIIDLWSDTDYRDAHEILANIIISLLVCIILIPLTFIADLIFSPIEILAVIVYWIGTKKDKEGK